MYVFKRDGQEVAAQEWPVWVQLQENGCYGLCNAADAQGVVLGGVVYSLSNRTHMEGTEEVAAEVVESVPYLREKMDTLESRACTAGRRTPMGELEVIEALCCLVERAVAVIRDEQTKEALLRELDAATGAEDMTKAP